MHVVMRQNLVPRIPFHAKFEVAVPNPAGNAPSYERRRHMIVEFLAAGQCMPQCGQNFVWPLKNFRDWIDEPLVVTRLMPLHRGSNRRHDVQRPAMFREKNLNARACGLYRFEKQFLFVHIPKTAGNSIQSILRDYSEDEIVALRSEQDGIERFGLRNPNYKIKKHSTLAEYRGALGEERFRSLYKFVCVRNPWDRMVSYYFTPTQSPETWDRKKFRGMISEAAS